MMTSYFSDMCCLLVPGERRRGADPVRALPEHRLDLRLERGLLDLLAGHALAHLLARLVEDERGAAGDAEPGREVAVPLPEDLEEAGAAGERLRHRLVLRGERLAGRALGRVEVQHHRLGRREHLALVVLGGDLLHAVTHLVLLGVKRARRANRSRAGPGVWGSG